ncbi:MAG TPA: cyclic nucleotide-binding domain-containing protein [Solirubrobacteraceae bacterium]|nr:cyclic nucleotide-binding domain-containing protein [Solirubrobacteraceae bacterium]
MAPRELGWRESYVRDWRMIRDPKVAVTTALAASRASNRAVWVGLGVIAATGFLRMGTAGVGELAAVAGIGTVASIPVGRRLIGRRRFAATLSLAVAGMGFPLLLIAVTGNALVALLVIPFWGLASAAADLQVGCLVSRVAARRVANAVSLNETVRNCAQAGATLLLPLSITVLDARSAMALWGGVQIAAAVVAKRRLDHVDADVGSHMRILDLVQAIYLFRPLRVVELEQVAASVSPRPMHRGEVVIAELDRQAESMFIIDSGTVAVSRRGQYLTELGAGQPFGEIALLHRTPRTATVTAVSDGILLELDRAEFIGAVSDFKANLGAFDVALAQPGAPVTLADVLQSLPPALLAPDGRGEAALAEAAVVRAVQQGDVLCAEGDLADRLFVLLAGSADVWVGEQLIDEVAPGRWFGEIGVLHRLPRTATVVARAAGTVVELPVDGLAASDRS